MIRVHCCTRCSGGFTDNPRRGMCHACYEKDRRAGNVPGLVDAQVARDKITQLVAAGWRYNEIARAARIDRTLIAFIMAGRQRINADTAFAICCVDPLRRLDYVKQIDPEVAKARGRKAAASLSAEAKAERSRKIWETRRANSARVAAELAAAERVVAEQAVRFEEAAELVALVDEKWRQDAVCAQIDPDLWFPEKGGATRQAKEMCLRCTVRQPCLEFALANEERFGIWGGKSERERRRMVKEREAVAVAS